MITITEIYQRLLLTRRFDIYTCWLNPSPQHGYFHGRRKDFFLGGNRGIFQE